MFRYSIVLGQLSFTAILQWEYPHYDGGTPITHYSIQIEDRIQHNTSKTSFKADFAYNTPVNVTLIAHNCVGHSDPFIAQIFHDGRFTIP